MTKEIKKLENELKTEIKKNGEYSKRATFLKATINRYLHIEGKASKY